MKILGIDIGGTGIKGAIVDVKNGKLVSDRFRIATPKPATPNKVSEVINEIKNHFEWEGDIGCTFPSVVINGKAKYSSNLDPSWKGVQIDDLFSDYCGGTHFTVINDADAAGIAELQFGAGRHKSGLVITITLGTGIGSAMFYDGQLLPNAELGHMYGLNDRPIEKYAADSIRKLEGLDYETWGKRVNVFLKNVERVFTPDFIIIGGGASKKIHKFRNEITITTPFAPCEKLNNAGIIGAAYNAADHHE
ncbi:MAG: polyphosphate--glucose phosphotransferase [Fulvivirga sp.]